MRGWVGELLFHKYTYYRSKLKALSTGTMKIIKRIMVGLALLLVCCIAEAAPTGHNNSTNDEVIDTYLNAVLHGKLANVNDAIDDDAQFNMKRGDRINTLDKAQIINALKVNENIEQDCQCTKTVLQDETEKKVLKVEMKYSDYTRTEVITTEHAGSGWKITKVEMTFK
jgi:hypothetical protein